MVKMLKLLAILSTVFSTSAYAQTSPTDCTSVDFRNEFPMKIRNQKSLAWCFAHAAADNLQFAEKTSVQISAADIAINYGNSGLSKVMNFFQGTPEERPNEFGLAKFASQALLKDGSYCPEEYFPSEDWKKVSANGVVQNVEISAAIKEIYALSDIVREGKVKFAADLPYSYQFKKVDKNLFFLVLQKIKKEKVLNQLRLQACDGVRTAFRHDIDVQMRLNSSRLVSYMNQYLDHGKSLSIDLYFPAFYDIDVKRGNITNLHTVMVFGRKYDSSIKECVYLIKNSFSESCNGYDKRLNCNKGYLWFPESSLSENMTSAVFYR